MSKRKGGFAAPVGEVADVVKEVVGETGKAVRGHQDNKTKRHISDNDAGVKHHEIDSTDLGKRFDFVIHGLSTLIHGIGAIGHELNESKKIGEDLQKTLEQEQTKRQKIQAELEQAKRDFELARDAAAMHHESWQNNYQKAVDQSRSAWDELLVLVKSDSISDKTRESFLMQMLDLQRGIKEITISYFEKDSAK